MNKEPEVEKKNQKGRKRTKYNDGSKLWQGAKFLKLTRAVPDFILYF